jgi:hypothetical protein
LGIIQENQKLKAGKEPCEDSRLGCPFWAKPGCTQHNPDCNKNNGRGWLAAPAFRRRETLNRPADRLDLNH